MLNASSPAIDAANPGGCLNHAGVLILFDQRGTASRALDGDGDGTARCDAGAYESVEVPTRTPTVTATATQTFTPTVTLTPTQTQTFTVTSTITLSPTLPNTATITLSPTITLTPTITPLGTLTPTRTRTNPPANTATRTATRGPTAIPTRTATRGPTAIPTRTAPPTSPFTLTPVRSFTATQPARPTFARLSATPTIEDGSGGGGLTETPAATGSVTGTRTGGLASTPTRTATRPPQLAGASPVGSEGGEIDCAPWTITVPPDTVPDGSRMRCDPAEVTAPPEGRTLVGGAIELRAFDGSGQPIDTFDPPLRMCFAYVDEDVRAASGNTANFVIMSVGPDGAWQESATSVDTALRTACADVDRVSKFGMYSRLAAQAPADNTLLFVVLAVIVAILLGIGLLIFGLLWSRREKPEETTPYGF
jgi:hypothetical protein